MPTKFVTNPRRNPLHLAHPGHFRQGQVVRLRGARKRYVIATDVDPEVFGYHLVALSGGEVGSAPSGIRASDMELDANQDVSFSGAQAKKLQQKYLRASTMHQEHQRSLVSRRNPSDIVPGLRIGRYVVQKVRENDVIVLRRDEKGDGDYLYRVEVTTLADLKRELAERAKLSARVDGTYVDERGEEVLRPAAKSRVPMRRNRDTAPTLKGSRENLFYRMSGDEVESGIRDDSLYTTIAKANDRESVVTLATTEPRRAYQAKWFVSTDRAEDFRRTLERGIHQPATANLLLGPEDAFTRDTDTKVRGRAKDFNIQIAETTMYLNPRRSSMTERETADDFLERYGHTALERLNRIAHNAELHYRPKDDPWYFGGMGGTYRSMYARVLAGAQRDRVDERAAKAYARIRGFDPEASDKKPATRRRNPDAATPRAFLSVLRSKLTQHDMRLSAKQPNMYRLGHYLAAAERVEKDMGKSLDSTSPAALEKLRQSLHKRFVIRIVVDRKLIHLVSAVERQIDAYLAKGTMPSLVRKNPPTGFRIGGPAVKTLSEGLRISKADAQRLKDMMDTGAPRILQAADKMMDGNGVERISGVGGGLMYVNMGDTYDTTLIYDYKTNRFVVSSWGDIVERQPRRFPD